MSGVTTTYRPTLKEALDGSKPTAAEQRVLDACQTGEHASFGFTVPDAPTAENTIRAGLIRFLMLGGCDTHQPHPKGVQITGAWVKGALDLEGCVSSLDLKLPNCHFPNRLILMDCSLRGLYLTGSFLARGMVADRLRTQSDVHLRQGFKAEGLVDLGGAQIAGQLSCINGKFDGQGEVALNCIAMTVGASVLLRDGFAATGEVNLLGAQIAGPLDCSKGKFDGQGGVALNCNAMTVGASVLLRDGFAATGEVNLVRAQITGQLDCSKAKFDGQGGVALNCNAMTVGASVLLRDGFAATGEVNLVRAQITGQLDCSKAKFDGQGGVALNCAAMTVGADVFLFDGFAATGEVNLVRAQIAGRLQFTKATVDGAFSLSDAKVGQLHDDRGSWAKVTQLKISGFDYASLSSDMRVSERLAWLGRKDERALWDGETEDFDPQPYTHLARLYDREGHLRHADRLRYERERRLRETANARGWVNADTLGRKALYVMANPWSRLWGVLYRWLFGFGLYPGRALVSSLVIVVLASVLYGATYAAGMMAPNSDLILNSPTWLGAIDAYERCLAFVKEGCELPLQRWGKSDPAEDYETFNAVLYALDLFVPLVSFTQEAAWAPTTTRGDLGWWAFYLRTPIQAAGWLITAVGAAVLTGLVGRRE